MRRACGSCDPTRARSVEGWGSATRDNNWRSFAPPGPFDRFGRTGPRKPRCRGPSGLVIPTRNARWALGMGHSACGLRRGLLDEGGGWYECGRLFAVEGDLAVLEGLQSVLVGGHGHPADSAVLQQAAGDFDGVAGVGMAEDDALSALDPDIMRAQHIGAIDRLGDCERLLDAFGCSLRETREVFLGHLLAEAAEGKLDGDDD